MGLNMKKSKIIDQLVKDLFPLILRLYYYDDLICPNCLRKVHNKKWFIKKTRKCIWCDAEYHWNKQKEKKR